MSLESIFRLWQNRVGINKTDPLATLHVGGDLIVDSGLTVSAGGIALPVGAAATNLKLSGTIDLKPSVLKVNDLWADRGNNDGVVFLGPGGSRYLQWDNAASEYYMPTSPLEVPGGFKGPLNTVGAALTNLAANSISRTGSVTSGAGGTTTSTSMVDITNATFTLASTVSGNPVLVVIVCGVRADSASSRIEVGVSVAGVTQSSGNTIRLNPAGDFFAPSACFVFVAGSLSGGTIVKGRWRSVDGTSISADHTTLVAIELAR